MESGYTEINVFELVFVVLKRWWLILLFVTIAGGASFLFTVNWITPIYEAKAKLFIGKEAEQSDDISLGEMQTDSKLVEDYRELLNTRMVTEQVINELGLSLTTSQIIKGLDVSVSNESRFIIISYEHPDPVIAADVTNMMAELLVESVQEVIGIRNVQFIDSALVPTKPVRPNVMQNVVFASGASGVLALVLIFIFFLHDNRIKNEKQLEEKLGLPVLGVIPKQMEGK